MTGLRLGFVHGPKTIIDEMIKLQQFTFVCARTRFNRPASPRWTRPSINMWSSIGKKRDYHAGRSCRGTTKSSSPTGRFTCSPDCRTGFPVSEFVKQAIENNLLLIPGHVFSMQDTHFRLAYAVSDDKLQQGVEILKRMAKTRLASSVATESAAEGS